jgi:dTDP-4-dehydrorhamnose 3,5-epimerase
MSAISSFVATPLAIPEVRLVKVRKFGDHRGYFMETYSRQKFAGLGIDCNFVQDNQSMSAERGTVRGLHYQNLSAPQAKLIRVLNGSIFDVAVDIRRGSPTFGRWCGAVLTAEAGEQIFIPRGFAHAFCTLEADTAVAYKVDSYYSPDCEAGIIWNDPDIAIDWPVGSDDVFLSEKDAALPRLVDVQSPFLYRD